MLAVALDVLLHVLSPAVGYALLFFCTCSSLFTRCGSALFTRCGSALFCHPSRCSGPQAKTPARRQSPVLDRASGFLSPASSSLVVFTQTADLRFRAVLIPGVAACECVSLASRAPYPHRLRSVAPWFVKGLRCLDELFARPIADPRVSCCAWSGGLPPSARCACRGRCLQSSVALNCRFTLGMVVTPPCRVCCHSRASPGTPRR